MFMGKICTAYALQMECEPGFIIEETDFFIQTDKVPHSDI